MVTTSVPLSLTGAAATTATAGCQGILRSADAAGVDGSWSEHGGDSSNTRQTAASGPVDDVAVRWTSDVGYSVRKTPAVADGRVYVGGDERMLAFDAATGRRAWGVRLEKDARPGDSTAAVAAGVVYVVVRNTLHALSASSGTRRWSRSFGLSHDHLQAPTVVGDTVYTTIASTGTVKALSTSDGAGRWTASVHRRSSGPPAIADGTLYVTTNSVNGVGLLVAFDAAGGEELWRSEVATADEAGPLATGPTVDEDHVYVGTVDGRVFALDVADGGEIWAFDPGTTRLVHDVRVSAGEPTPAPVSGGLAIGTDTVYVAHGDGRLYALDAATGERRWSFRSWAQLDAPPAVGDGAVYVGSHDTFVYALSPVTGERLWEVSAASGFTDSAPAIVDGHVFVGSADGTLYALWEGSP